MKRFSQFLGIHRGKDGFKQAPNTVLVRNKVRFGIPTIAVGTQTGTISCNIPTSIVISGVAENVVLSTNTWRIRVTYKNGNSQYLMDNAVPFEGVFNGTADNPIVLITYRSDNMTSGQYSNVQVRLV